LVDGVAVVELDGLMLDAVEEHYGKGSVDVDDEPKEAGQGVGVALQPDVADADTLEWAIHLCGPFFVV